MKNRTSKQQNAKTGQRPYPSRWLEKVQLPESWAMAASENPAASVDNFSLDYSFTAHPGELVTVYTWDSTTGSRPDLTGATIREYVTLDSSVPSPFNLNFTYPATLPGNVTLGTIADIQSIPHLFSPYVNGAYTAEQVFQFKGATDPSFVDITAPQPIVRSVYENGGVWYYKVTKGPNSSIRPLT